MPMQTCLREFTCDYGYVLLAAAETSLTGLVITETMPQTSIESVQSNAAHLPTASQVKLFEETISQIEQYLSGKRKSFELPVLYPYGTEFERKIWDAAREIPYGKTATYGELALMCGHPRAARAAGSAMHNNPLMLIVPCHRVIGADGSLHGFGGGLGLKKRLLTLEGCTFRENRVLSK